MARYVEGQSLNTIWVVRSLGIDPANGKELFLDKNGKRTYDWNADDYVAEATTDPRLYGNLGLGIFYRGFSLNTYVNYSLGEKAYNQTLVDRVENIISVTGGCYMTDGISRGTKLFLKM